MQLALSGLRTGNLLVFVWLHTAQDPTDDEWNEAFAAMASIRRKEIVSFAEMRCFIITDGGAPNGVQRKRIGLEYPIKSSVITTALSNPVKRGIATAISWLNPRYFFGAPNEAMRAARHLDLAEQWDTLWPVYLELQKQLPRNHTLALVGAELGRRIPEDPGSDSRTHSRMA